MISLQAASPHYFLTTAGGYIPSETAPIALDQPGNAGSVAYDPQGVLYYGLGPHIFRLNPDGTDTLIAGSAFNPGKLIEGQPAVDAPAEVFGGPFAFDGAGNLYVAADGQNLTSGKVYKITPDGIITTFAGTGGHLSTVLSGAGPGIPGTSISLSPLALTTDPENNVYVATSIYQSNSPCWAVFSFPEDGSSSTLVAIDPPGHVCALGTASTLNALVVTGPTLLMRYLYVTYQTDLANGSSNQGVPAPTFPGDPYARGPNGQVYFVGKSDLEEFDVDTNQTTPIPNSSAVAGFGPQSLAVNPITGDVAMTSGTVNVFTAATGNFQAVAGNAPTFSGDGGPATLASMNPGSLAADASGLYLSGQNRIRKITPNGMINTIAGTGTGGDTGDGDSAVNADISPGEMAVDGLGNLYFINAAAAGTTIRKIDSKGTITTVAGGGTEQLASGVTGTNAKISPKHLASDSAGDLYFDNMNQLYKLSASGTVSLIAGSGVGNAVPNGTPALSAGVGPISSIAVNGSGTVYFGDQRNQAIWKIDANSNLQLVAGLNVDQSIFQAPILAGVATSVDIYVPTNLAFDAQGNLYLCPNNYGSNLQLARVDTLGNLTIIGGGGTAFPGDGADATLAHIVEIDGIAIDGSGNIYFSQDGLIREMSPFNPASPPPFIASGGIVGPGGSVPAVQAISPGGVVSIFGANFIAPANAHTVQTSDLVNGKIPTNLEGVCVNFGSTPAAMIGVYPNQLNVQVAALQPGAVTVQLTVNCGTPQAVASNLAGVVVQTASPEFYSFKPDPIGGVNPIAAVNATTGALIGPSGLLPGVTMVPAKPGDVVQAYATGFGASTPSYGLGAIPGAAGALNSPYSLTLGGAAIPASDVIYAGISPCCAGFYQVDFKVPAGTPSGALPLVITIAGQASPANAYIEVHQ